jgi:hypothetical protein
LRGDVLTRFGKFDEAAADLRTLQRLQHSNVLTRKVWFLCVLRLSRCLFACLSLGLSPLFYPTLYKPKLLCVWFSLSLSLGILQLEEIRRGKAAQFGLKGTLLTEPTAARCHSSRRQVSQLLEVAPNAYEGLLYKARCALVVGEPHDALEATRTILQEQKRDIPAMELRAQAYFSIGQPELAVK